MSLKWLFLGWTRGPSACVLEMAKDLVNLGVLHFVHGLLILEQLFNFLKVCFYVKLGK